MPMYGVVFSFKDSFDTADMRSTGGGDAAYDIDFPARDQLLIQQLRDKGAIIFAKAINTEYNGRAGDPGGKNHPEKVLASTLGYQRSSWGGNAVNPYDTTRAASLGSSSGSALSVSVNLVMASLGEETRASCRGPSNHNAIALILPHKAMLGFNGGAIGAAQLDHELRWLAVGGIQHVSFVDHRGPGQIHHDARTAGHHETETKRLDETAPGLTRRRRQLEIHLRKIHHHAVGIGQRKGAGFDLAVELKNEAGLPLVAGQARLGCSRIVRACGNRCMRVLRRLAARQRRAQQSAGDDEADSQQRHMDRADRHQLPEPPRKCLVQCSSGIGFQG